MSSSRMEYDLPATQFFPDGRIFQVVRAHNFVDNSGTVIGLRGKDCVVLAVERLATSNLIEPHSKQRIFNIDAHVCMAVSGLINDVRQIVETARSTTTHYHRQYDQNIQINVLSEHVASYIHSYTLSTAVRPFDCSVIFGGYDSNGPSMYMVDPSGVTNECNGCAIGNANQAAKTEIEKLKLSEMSCYDLVREAVRIIYLVREEVKDTQFELEMRWVGVVTSGKHENVPDVIFSEAEKAARLAM